MSVSFRGGRTCSCVATSLPLVEADMLRRGLIKYNIDIYQLGYRGDVRASAGTHNSGGCTDVGQDSDAQIAVWRAWGWTMQRRYRSQGFSPHAHGWPLGCPHLSSGARGQARLWSWRRNGLRSNGRVEGRWPIPTWRASVAAANKQVKRRAVKVAAVKRKQEAEMPSARDVLTLDGVIQNVFTSNPANKFVALSTALVVLGKRTASTESRLVRQQKQLDRIEAAIKGLAK